ncbi:hypothetical protein Tco_0278670 [Tanacetum coccineum]
MSNMSEDIQYAGSDTRPPMLDRTDFESWQQRIRLYCLGKDNGENIMKSITEGPFKMGTMRDIFTEGGEGALHLGPERAKVFTDLSAEQKDMYKANIRATNILLQGKLNPRLSLDDKLNFVEELVEIMDREVKKLKQSRIPIVKVRWNSKRGPKFTWEREDQIRAKYPHLFSNITPASN